MKKQRVNISGAAGPQPRKLSQWTLIKAELGLYGGEEETAEILADEVLMNSIRKGRGQAEQKIGKPLSEVEV